MKAIKNKELRRCNCCGKVFLQECDKYTSIHEVFKIKKRIGNYSLNLMSNLK